MTWTVAENILLRNYSFMENSTDGSTCHIGGLCYLPIDITYCQTQQWYNSSQVVQNKGSWLPFKFSKIRDCLRRRTFEPPSVVKIHSVVQSNDILMIYCSPRWRLPLLVGFIFGLHVLGFFFLSRTIISFVKYALTPSFYCVGRMTVLPGGFMVMYYNWFGTGGSSGNMVGRGMLFCWS